MSSIAAITPSANDHVRARRAMVLGFVILAISVTSGAWFAFRLQQAFLALGRSLEVQNQISVVQTRIQDAETSARTYMLTGDSAYLVPYEASGEQLDNDLNVLEGRIQENASHRAALTRLRSALEAREAVQRRTINLYRPGGTVSAAARLASLETGSRLMGDVRDVVREMQSEEARVLAGRRQVTRLHGAVMILVLVLSALTSLGLGLFVFIDARRRLAMAMASRDAVALSNARLRAEAASRQAAEAQVRQMQKMEAVGQLTGGIAHDFNNMLAIVIGALDMAKRRLHTDVARADILIDNALEGAQRAAQLTSRLLAFSRQQPLAPSPLDANKLMGGMSEMLRRTIGDNLRVHMDLEGGLWRIYADPGQLENAILNLAVNARDAMPDGGDLTLETRNVELEQDAAAQAGLVPGQYVVISVSDTGVGMSAEVIERAFDPFYTTKGVGRGTGLGLSQVHGFVRQSRGHVNIQSKPGMGTTVRIYLPRYQGAELAADTDESQAAELPRARAGEVVLVVEDEERVRGLSVDALKELGYQVIFAENGVKALKVMRKQPRVDLMFTDIVMPEMDGRRLAEKAREIWPDLKILFTTGYTREAILRDDVVDPNVGFLAKPFTLDQLSRKARQVLDGRLAAQPTAEV